MIEMYAHFQCAAPPYRIKPGRLDDFINGISELAMQDGQSMERTMDCIDLDGRDKQIAERIITVFTSSKATPIVVEVVRHNPNIPVPVYVSAVYDDGLINRIVTINNNRFGIEATSTDGYCAIL